MRPSRFHHIEAARFHHENRRAWLLTGVAAAAVCALVALAWVMALR